MTVPFHSSPVTRRLFLEKSVKGTTALAISGLVFFGPLKGLGADRSPTALNIPRPQYPAWTPDGRLLVTFIAEDGSYGLLQNAREAGVSDRYLAVGTATGQFNWPQGIAVDGITAYIVDSNNGRIQRYDAGAQGFLEPFGRLGKKSGLFLRPEGICVSGDEILIADTRNHRIQVFSKDGAVKRVFGELGDAEDQFRLPTSCAVTQQGEVFVVDSKHALVKVFDLEGRFKRKFGGLSSVHREPGLMNMPKGIALDEKTGAVFVADTGNSRIQAFDYIGKFLRSVEAPGMAFKAPQGIALLGSSNMAITDPDAGKVWVTTV